MAAGAGGRRVFVYGSLMSDASLLRTLAHRRSAPPSEPFLLRGWERAWNVVSARTFALADDPSGPLHRRLVLGLRPRPGARCEGVVLDLDADDLAALAPREAAYELTEVASDGRGGSVSTFLPLAERTIGHRAVAEPLVIEGAYLAECLAGAAAHELTKATAELVRTSAGAPIADAA